MDYRARFFAPRQGIDEDPVTGSAHCCLAPYWASKLGRRVEACRACRSWVYLYNSTGQRPPSGYGWLEIPEVSQGEEGERHH